MTPEELAEHRLRIQLMQADIANKEADTRFKKRAADWEPWKVVATVGAACAAIGASLATILTLLLTRH